MPGADRIRKYGLMRVFRIEKEKYLNQALSGKGAALSPRNRWNGFGTFMVYTAHSRALALLELAVHLDFIESPIADRHFVEIDIPDNLQIVELTVDVLPKNWQASPPGNETQQVGDHFVIQQQAAVLKVPSSIVPQEFNYLINPLHKHAGRITKISQEIIRIDHRLLKATNPDT